MDDIDIIEKRAESVAKRKKLYLFLGWPVIALGFAVVFTGMYRPAGIGLIILGAVMRLLYYISVSELKSLNKYASMIDKKSTVILFFLLIYSCSLSIFAQLKRGDDAAEFANVEWIRGDSFKLHQERAEEDIPLTVVEFWATWDKASQLSMPLLQKMHKKYSADNIVFLAISQEKRDKVQDFLEKSKAKVDFRVGLDTTGMVTRMYMGDSEGYPAVFIIDKNYDVLWRGQPLDLEMVLDQIAKKTFDPYLLAKVTELHKKLQEEMQLERIPAAIETIKEIMELDPDDKLAMRVRLYLFEREGNLPGAIPFLDSLIEKSPETSSLYFVKLDVMNRIFKTPDEIEEYCKEIYDKFQDSNDVLEHLAWVAAFRLPLGTAPLGVAYDAIEKAVTGILKDPNSDPAKLANYLETQARVYYLVGKIAKALEIQERVVRLRNGDDNQEKSKAAAAYYRKALEVYNR